MQQWGPDTARQSTVISEHATVAETFREINRLASEMVRTGAPSDAVGRVVVDGAGQVVRRPCAH